MIFDLLIFKALQGLLLTSISFWFQNSLISCTSRSLAAKYLNKSKGIFLYRSKVAALAKSGIINRGRRVLYEKDSERVAQFTKYFKESIAGVSICHPPITFLLLEQHNALSIKGAVKIMPYLFIRNRREQLFDNRE